MGTEHKSWKLQPFKKSNLLWSWKTNSWNFWLVCCLSVWFVVFEGFVWLIFICLVCSVWLRFYFPFCEMSNVLVQLLTKIWKHFLPEFFHIKNGTELTGTFNSIISVINFIYWLYKDILFIVGAGILTIIVKWYVSKVQMWFATHIGVLAFGKS